MDIFKEFRYDIIDNEHEFQQVYVICMCVHTYKVLCLFFRFNQRQGQQLHGHDTLLLASQEN